MKIRDEKIRTIKINIEYHEILKLLIDKIRTDHSIEFTQFDKFNFEFIKEGYPEYSTRKIKCTAVKQINETPPNATI